MDNKELLNEQNTDQAAEKQELTSIERAKALFEYEMTEVLLNFKNEVRAVKDSPAAEYINMEVPKSGVAYDAPDIAVEGAIRRPRRTSRLTPTRCKSRRQPPLTERSPRFRRLRWIRALRQGSMKRRSRLLL